MHTCGCLAFASYFFLFFPPDSLSTLNATYSLFPAARRVLLVRLCVSICCTPVGVCVIFWECGGRKTQKNPPVKTTELHDAPAAFPQKCFKLSLSDTHTHTHAHPHTHTNSHNTPRYSLKPQNRPSIRTWEN